MNFNKLNLSIYHLKVIALFIFLFSSLPLFATCEYLSVLNGEVQENGNALSWSTSMEINNNFFLVERSIDGITFERAAKIEGAGNADKESKYSFVDLLENSNRSFYRLMQVDFDGNTTFSHTVVLTRTQEEPLFLMTTINSSTTDRYLNFSLNSKVKDTTKYRVMTRMGEVVKKGNAPLLVGDNPISIDLESLDVGRYQLAIKVKNEISILSVKKVDSNELPQVNLATKGKDD